MRITKKWKNIISIALAALVLFGAVGAVASFATNDSKPAGAVFKVGGLDPETGKYVKTDKTIYTEEAFECIGLRIEPDFESTVKYDVYYYDEEGTFLDSRLGLFEVHDEDFPLAKFARVVIHPEKPEDVSSSDWKISIFDVMKYAKMIDIRVDKKQDFLYDDSKNLYIDASAIAGKGFGLYWYQTDLNSLDDSSGRKVFSVDIDDKYEKYDVYIYLLSDETAYSEVLICSMDGKAVSSGDFKTYSFRNPANFVKPIWIKLTVENPCDEGGNKLAVCIPEGSSCYIYGYND